MFEKKIKIIHKSFFSSHRSCYLLNVNTVYTQKSLFVQVCSSLFWHHQYMLIFQPGIPMCILIISAETYIYFKSFIRMKLFIKNIMWQKTFEKKRKRGNVWNGQKHKTRRKYILKHRQYLVYLRLAFVLCSCICVCVILIFSLDYPPPLNFWALEKRTFCWYCMSDIYSPCYSSPQSFAKSRVPV